MEPRVLKTEGEYEAALAEIDAYMDKKPKPGSPDGDRFELLLLLVDDYESRNFRMEAPDPIDAIRFRMEQQGLQPRDLIPYLGSRSRVSEVLSGKRALTLTMIKALHDGLGIPAESLLRGGTQLEEDIDWERFPLKEMADRGWIDPRRSGTQGDAETAVRESFHFLRPSLVPEVLCRRTRYVRAARPMDEYALLAWSARVLELAAQMSCSAAYDPSTINLEFMQALARLSVHSDGPLRAQQVLQANGVALVIERHLARTYLDGAAIMDPRLPVIGLTLRHDRVDNFWFTLMHELAHLALHRTDEDIYFDDLDVGPTVDGQESPRERQADELASEALIPEDEWRKSAASRLRSPEAAESLAKKLGIHPGIVAGRMRYEFKAYRLLNNLVGHGEVRGLFPQIDWSD